MRVGRSSIEVHMQPKFRRVVLKSEQLVKVLSHVTSLCETVISETGKIYSIFLYVCCGKKPAAIYKWILPSITHHT